MRQATVASAENSVSCEGAALAGGASASRLFSENFVGLNSVLGNSSSLPDRAAVELRRNSAGIGEC